MNKKITITALIMLVLIILLSGGVQAYQSIPTGDIATHYGEYWFAYIRKIEASTGGMGLNETINASTLLATTESNNIDVHMQKNTEYGAAVLLSASAYGKQGNGTEGSNYVHTSDYGLATSTGNVYGIYELGRGVNEWVASGNSNVSQSINTRYIDRYTSETSSQKNGDATYATAGWHSGTAGWMTGGVYTYGFIRGLGSPFGYTSKRTDDKGTSKYAGTSRAVIVSGEGF